jgi:hypothetical protein
MSADSPKLQHLGPAWRYAGRAVFFNPGFLPALFLVLFAFCHPFRNWVYLNAPEWLGKPAIVQFYRFQKAAHLGEVAALFLGGTLSFGLLRQLTTSYTMNDEFIYVQEGIFGRYTNTVAKTMVFDCDIEQGFFQVLFGTGDLLIRTVDHQSVRLRFVPNPRVWRDVIMNGTAVRDTRIVGAI